jgi:MscS family membrane protein
MVKKSVTLTILLVLCIAASAFAAQKPRLLPGAKETQKPVEPEVAYTDPLGRSTPQGTVFGFVKSASKGDYDQTLQYLDTKITGIRARKLIDAVQGILDRGFSGKPAMLSNKPEGYLDDNLPPSKERVGTVETPSGSLDILLERVQRGNNPPIWLFSAETLKNVQEIYKELDVRTIRSYLPKFLVNTWLLWFPLWQWLLILLLIPLSFGLSILVTRLFNLMLLLVVHRIARVRVDHHVARLTGPVRILIFALAIWSITLLSRSVLMSAFWTYVALTLTVIGATWLCVRVIDALFKLKQSQFTSSDKIAMAQLGRKLSKIMAVILGTLVIFYIAGINIAAVLTGLGIGGIAIAFAAQKTLENLFGGIMIISDHPIGVGDFCRAGDYLGTVENIGLRSTRIRTLERTVVSVPNGQLALMSLENFTIRDKIWFHHTLHLRYETTADQLRYILAGIRKMLVEHSKVESPSASARTRFIGFGNSSLDVEVFAYVLETEYEPFLHIQEDLLLRIMDIVEASGSNFALPSQTTYLAGDAGLDAAKSQKAIETVCQWREQGKLPFPDFSPETISEIDSKIEYPPPESALRDKRKE